MRSGIGRFVLVGLVVLTAISVWRAVASEREKYRLDRAYREAQQMVQELSSEREKLNQELAGAKETIEGQSGNITNLQQELQGVQGRLEKTLADIESLQKEREQLARQNDTIGAQLGMVTAQKQQLEAKLSDLKELRLAIHDVRRKMWNRRLAAWRVRIQTLKDADEQKLASGNRGYIVRDGTPTLGASPRLRVQVLEPQAQ